MISDEVNRAGEIASSGTAVGRRFPAPLAQGLSGAFVRVVGVAVGVTVTVAAAVGRRGAKKSGGSGQ